MSATLSGTLADGSLSKGPFRAARGSQLSCKGWQQEAALRMLMNNLDPEVAEKPEDLVVYGGTGKAARNWECFHAIVRSLKALESDETLLVQSGKPVAVFRTHEYAPRVLLCNSNLTGHWNNWEKFRELDRAGLMMYGQMTAGSWIYIGTQGILQGTYETFAAAARKHFGGDLAGKLVVTGGMGGMGGAQPLAATMNGAAFLGIDVDPERIKRRVKGGYCDVMVTSLDEALRILKNAVRKREATSVGLVGNCADLIPELAKRGVVPDLLTDQTSAHDPIGGYVPEWHVSTKLRSICARKTRKTIAIGLLQRWPNTSKACSTCRSSAPSPSITAIIFERSPTSTASKMLTIFLDLSPRIFARSSAKAKARSAGLRFPVKLRTLHEPTNLSWKCFRTTNI